jgi:hypothetical protein
MFVCTPAAAGDQVQSVVKELQQKYGAKRVVVSCCCCCCWWWLPKMQCSFAHKHHARSGTLRDSSHQYLHKGSQRLLYAARYSRHHSTTQYSLLITQRYYLRMLCIFPTQGKACNVSKADQVKALAEYAQQQLGSIDLWINNAGTNAYKYGPLLDSDDEDLEAIVDTNILGVMLCCKEVRWC